MATQTEIRRRLALYKLAEAAVLKNQSYTIGNRTFTRASLNSIRAEIKELEQQLTAYEGNGGSIRPRKVLMRDD